MDAAETVKLCKIIRSISPTTAKDWDEDTPTTWWAILADTVYADALEAVKRLARRTPWIGTAEICTEVSAIRRARVAEADAADELVPNVDPDDPVAYNAERRAIMRAAADGTLDIGAYVAGGLTLTGVTPRKAIGSGAASPGAVQEAMRSAGVGRRVPRPDSTEATSATVGPVATRELEEARARQLAAMTAAMEAEAQ